MMNESADKKSSDNTHYLAAVNSLLETINDKDEQVRSSVESALCRMCKGRPNETIEVICDFKQKTPKLHDVQTAILLRVIENYVKHHSDQLSETSLDKVINLCVTEMIKYPEHTLAIHNPCLEILVSVGRIHCSKVMDGLSKQLATGQASHFMVLHCMGRLATANISGIIQFIRPTLETILPTLSMIKSDHVKQAYSFAIGHFAEAISEHLSNAEENSSDNAVDENHHTELAIAYPVLLNHWLPNREPKVSSDILEALSHIYPLLPREKVLEQVPKVIPLLQSFYRRSMDRNAITTFLASVLKTSIDTDRNSLDSLSDSLIINLFDLVCVIPDYEKPQTVKGHYEVLRCFDLLVPIYSTKIIDMLLVQLRSNNERERIKALLVVTHITNTASEIIAERIPNFTEVLKHMIHHEKTIKVKLVLLKTLVALAQKALLQDSDFIRFILQHCCQHTKINQDHGSADEFVDFMQACKNSLYILATTVGTIDDLLKRELLHHYLLFEYTDIAGTIAKCLAKLFEKNDDLSFVNGDAENTKSNVPSPETVFARSLILLGNSNQSKRSENVLKFLKYYAKVVHKLLFPLWSAEIPKLLQQIKQLDFQEKVFKFVIDTIKEYDNPAFPETMVNKLADQLTLYPFIIPVKDFYIPQLHQERGMLMKLIGICLCYVTDNQTIEAKIELIIITTRQEKLDKIQNNIEFDSKLSDGCAALGYVSKIHLDLVLNKLDQLISEEGQRKSGGNFFSNLTFIKDSHKEIEIYKVNLFAIEAYERIIENLGVPEALKDFHEKVINYLTKQLNDAKDITMKKKILSTLLTITQYILKYKELCTNFKCRTMLLAQLLKVDASYDNLPLYPAILKLSTNLLQIDHPDEFRVHEFFEESCRKFFTAAQQLKNKFDSVEEDERNSFIAKYLNISLPELNHLVKVIFEQNPSPSTLDDVSSVLEYWIRDKNSEVRICAGHVFNSALNHYTKSMKLGCEAPSKFNQSGTMLGKIVPRCIDTNATVRQTSVDILRRILEISCIYETLTIADNNDEWIKDLTAVREDIVTDDPKEIYQITGEIARIISLRLSNFQYMQFCKTLLNALDDSEQSSAIGASVVLKNFIQIKGSELFHTVPEFVKESLSALNECSCSRAKSGVLKSLVALAKHHPKSVCSEMIATSLPYQSNVNEFWQYLSNDPDLCGVIIDHFISVITSSPLYEPPHENTGSHQNIATHHPFAIFCALREIFQGKEIQLVLKQRFADLFAILLTSVATYINLAPPMASPPASNTKTKDSNTKTKYGFVPNKELAKLNPCQMVLETFQAFLSGTQMDQIAAVLTVCPNLATSTELNHFMELLSPMAVGLVNQLGITSSTMSQVIQALSKYIASPYDNQRISSVGLYSQIVPLKPSGEIASVIMLHLNSALGDPNPLVRGFCVRGMAYVSSLTEHDMDKYSENSLSALLKGIDDNFDPNCFINIPLESMKGLSRIVVALHKDKLESFQVSLAIRIRPFFENPSSEIREAAILLFGDLCKVKETHGNSQHEPTTPISEALREQLIANFCTLLLHLSETNSQVVRACKVTLRKICTLMEAPKVSKMIQSHLLEHGNLHYEVFLTNFTKIINEELSEHVPDFIESCLPHLKSQWPELRGNATILIGLLYNLHTLNHDHPHEHLSQKIAQLLHDDQNAVRVKAANALGFMYGEVI